MTCFQTQTKIKPRLNFLTWLHIGLITY